MLERKITRYLRSWYDADNGRALLLTGARQVGKTTAVREFARAGDIDLAEVNFYQNVDAVELVSQAKTSDDLLMRLSVLAGRSISPGSTLLFLDEIQECQDLLTWVKFLSEDRGLKVVLSGSLLGIDAFVDVRSLPVGYLQTREMFPLDFEEFCWAAGLPAESFVTALDAALGGEAVPDFLHHRLGDLFRTYLLVGGMPASVQEYVDSAQIAPVRETQRAIFDMYEADVAKYVSDRTEARQIKMVYEAIPGQLNAPSKRFKYARLEKNLRFANLETAFDWLAAAGVAVPVTRVGSVEFPLGLTEDRTSLKLFMNDVGMLTSRLLGNVEIEVLSQRTNINYGSIFENVVAQELLAQGFTSHYYFSKKNGEVDFVVEDTDLGLVLPIEVKSGKDYKRHNALNNLLADEHSGIDRAVVLCDGNVEADGDELYLPVYLAGAIRRLMREA